MIIYKIKDMVGGWFAGNFSPTAFDTDQFEVAYKFHTAGEKWETHYHEKITEINFMIRGKMVLQNTEINSGDIFILKPYEIADPTFLEDCEMIVIKTPSVINDKIVVK